jgi:hypothetical protein
VVRLTNHHWKAKLPSVIEDHLESTFLGALRDQSEKQLSQATNFAVQCHTLYTGTQCGMPLAKEQAVEQFQKDISFLREKLKTIAWNKGQLDETRKFRLK